MKASWVKVGLAVAGVTVALKKATEAHAVQLKAELALSNALRLNAKEGEATLDMWKNYASSLQEATIFGDEMTLQQVAMLKTMGLSDDKTKELIETAMDYATAFGKDVPSAVRELTMTLSGQLGTIKRTIPSIGEFTKAQLKNGDAIKAVSKLMKGQAEALADTNWGKAQQNANKFGDEMEMVGKQFLEFASKSGGLNLVSQVITGLSLTFQFLYAGIRDVSSAFGEFFGILDEKVDKQQKSNDVTKEELTLEEKLNSYQRQIQENTTQLKHHQDGLKRVESGELFGYIDNLSITVANIRDKFHGILKWTNKTNKPAFFCIHHS